MMMTNFRLSEQCEKKMDFDTIQSSKIHFTAPFRDPELIRFPRKYPPMVSDSFEVPFEGLSPSPELAPLFVSFLLLWVPFVFALTGRKKTKHFVLGSDFSSPSSWFRKGRGGRGKGGGSGGFLGGGEGVPGSRWALPGVESKPRPAFSLPGHASFFKEQAARSVGPEGPSISILGFLDLWISGSNPHSNPERRKLWLMYAATNSGSFGRLPVALGSFPHSLSSNKTSFLGRPSISKLLFLCPETIDLSSWTIHLVGPHLGRQEIPFLGQSSSATFTFHSFQGSEAFQETTQKSRGHRSGL